MQLKDRIFLGLGPKTLATDEYAYASGGIHLELEIQHEAENERHEQGDDQMNAMNSSNACCGAFQHWNSPFFRRSLRQS